MLLPSEVLEPDLAQLWVDAGSKQAVPILRLLLRYSPPDVEAVHMIVNSDSEGQLTSYDILGWGDFRISMRTASRIEMLIFDAGGRLYGRTGHPVFPLEGISYDPSSPPGLASPLEAALSGELEPTRLVATNQSPYDMIVAIPVTDGEEGQGSVLGAVVYLIRHVPTRSDTTANTLRIIGQALLMFLAGAAFLGAVFGAATAENMVQRFSRLAAAAKSWSKGDFGALVDDKGEDEISGLAQTLNGMARQLQELLARRQEVAIAEERSRLARDLHDSAKQQAFAASAQLGAALALSEQDPEKARSHLAEASRLVDEVRKELTDLILKLRPGELEDGGLDAALRQLATSWAHQSDIEMDVQVQGEGALPLDVEQALFRIAQEALANTARHSGASRATLWLGFDGDGVALALADDGQGFDPDAPVAGMGLQSMRERAELMGGEFAVESAPGEGTRVSVRWPAVGVEGGS